MLRPLLHSISALFRSRTDSALEILPLRQQLAIFKTKRPQPKLSNSGRPFWIAMRRWWPNWQRALLIVQPETIVKWHRRGFRVFWRRKSRSCSQGRPKLESEIRHLIRTIATENPSWRAPRIHAELQMLGIEVAESTVSKYLPRTKPDPDAIRR